MNRFLLIAFIVVLAGLPLLSATPEFWITQLNYIGLAAMVALGLVLLTGVGGLTSFGQAAFVGLGAYTTALLTTQYDISPWLALPVGLLVTAVVAFLLGLITLRLSGIICRWAPSPGGSRCITCSATWTGSASMTASPASSPSACSAGRWPADAIFTT